jgi:hypothetical protein
VGGGLGGVNVKSGGQERPTQSTLEVCLPRLGNATRHGAPSFLVALRKSKSFG